MPAGHNDGELGFTVREVVGEGRFGSPLLDITEMGRTSSMNRARMSG